MSVLYFVMQILVSVVGIIGWFEIHANIFKIYRYNQNLISVAGMIVVLLLVVNILFNFSHIAMLYIK